MELIEKFRTANGLLEVLAVEWQDEIGGKQTDIQTVVRYNGFVEPNDYRDDLFRCFVEYFNNTISVLNSYSSKS